MTEKVIHVDAYTRSDGTYVREHERHIDSNNDYYANEEDTTLLQSGIKVNHYLENLENDFSKSKAREQELLDELSQTEKGNQANLLKEYAELKDKNTNDEKIISTIKYLLYDNGLKNAQKDKQYLDRFIGIVKHFGLNDAGQFWNMSSHGFDNKKAEEYITKNGKIYSQIEELPVQPEIQRAVRNKVKQQLNKDNLIGVSFHKDSSVAKSIARSGNFNNIIRQNFSKLCKGEHINTSVSFNKISEPNLFNAFGKVDILDLHINKDGDIEAYVLDTYDFNEGSTEKFVQKARNAQEHNLINNYYTLTKIIKKI